MRAIKIPGCDLFVSRFTFGTASLFNAGTSKQRLHVLSAAYDHGFTHFDTAPYYGFGIAERDLKPLLAAHRNITVATKVGIYSPGGEAQPAAAVFLRKAAGKIVSSLSRPIIDGSVARARHALTGSLRRLGRERIDLYLLHEPDISLFDTDEWLRWLESKSDRVANFGVAGDPRHLQPFVQSNNPLAACVQTLDSNEGREADFVLNQGRPLQITFGYVSGARRKGPVDIAATLDAALRRNVDGSIIVSTSKPERMAQYAAISGASDKATWPVSSGECS